MRQDLFLFPWFGRGLEGQIQASLARLKTQGGKAESGQGLVEYAFILVLIALIVIIVVALFGNAVEEMYNYAITQLVNVFTGGASP